MQLESEANLRRAKQVYIARYEEYEKAKTAASRAEEEGSSSTAKAVDKKKRLEEEARNKVCLVYNTHEALVSLYDAITLMKYLICFKTTPCLPVSLSPTCQAEEAEATYRVCVADATQQQQELEHTKVTVLRQIQEVIKQSDQTLRSVSVHLWGVCGGPWESVLISPFHHKKYMQTMSQHKKKQYV